MKPVVRLTPAAIQAMPWSTVEGAPRGVSERLLARDPESGAISRLLKVEAGVALDEVRHDLLEETYVLEGAFRVDGTTLAAGSYVCRRPGDVDPPRTSDEGFIAFQTQDVGDVPKPAAVLTHQEVEALPWEREQDFVESKYLARTEDGSFTTFYRIAGWAPVEAEEEHECTEEVLFLEGVCHEDGTPNPAGMFTCFPPRTLHGPYTFHEPILIFETKNYRPGARPPV